MLQNQFLELASATTGNKLLPAQCWQEITDYYQQPGRHYHNLDHIAKLIAELESCRHLQEDHNSLLYAAFYHDIIYDVSRNDNEEQSALLAEVRMHELNAGEERTQRCRQHILATRAHRQHETGDTNLFTDADLAILGKAPEQYRAYCQAIRAEYSIYPDERYLPGRAKVLQHFLDMPYIYKTGHFQDLYEKQARINISEELVMLR
jgi:predicted metal-dependent HD superfamily phosphohydrolase